MKSEKRKSTLLPHRGANGDMAKFASKFLEQRLEGFEKDMQICLAGTKSKTSHGITHAYFPALMSCCGTLEYFSSLYAGEISEKFNVNNIKVYTKKFLSQTHYTADSIHILYHAFRHTVAHRGIASGVWVDKHNATKGRRIVWKIGADTRASALQIKKEVGALRFDSPWECPYTHRVHISLGRLWRDIRDSVIAENGYRDTLISNEKLLKNFEDCMKKLYPK